MLKKSRAWGYAAPKDPGTLALGDGESCPGGGRRSRRACGGQQLPMAPAHQPGATGSAARVAVGAQRGPAGGSKSQRPGHAILGGRGVLPGRWWVLKERLRGVAVPHGPGTPAWGGAGNPAQAVVGSQGGPAGGSSFEGPGHNSLGGGGGSPAQAVVGAQRGPVGGSSSQWPGNTSLGGLGVLPNRWTVLKKGLRGARPSPSPYT